MSWGWSYLSLVEGSTDIAHATPDHAEEGSVSDRGTLSLMSSIGNYDLSQRS